MVCESKTNNEAIYFTITQTAKGYSTMITKTEGKQLVLRKPETIFFIKLSINEVWESSPFPLLEKNKTLRCITMHGRIISGKELYIQL